MVDSQLPTLLHVGFEKTGSKSIQYWLRDHEQLLAEHGLRFPRGWLRLNVHQELPLTLMRQGRLCGPREAGWEWRDVRWCTEVIEQIAADLWEHSSERTILSSENLDLLRHDDEFAALRELVGDAEVVMYLREPADWLEALRDQYLHKNTVKRPLSTDRAAYNYLAPDSWRCDYDVLVEQWMQWFTSVRVIDYDAVGGRDGSVLPSFLELLGLPLVDADYRLNTRSTPTPRDPGNRELGLLFGQSSQCSGMPSVSSSPAN